MHYTALHTARRQNNNCQLRFWRKPLPHLWLLQRYLPPLSWQASYYYRRIVGQWEPITMVCLVTRQIASTHWEADFVQSASSTQKFPFSVSINPAIGYPSIWTTTSALHDTASTRCRGTMDRCMPMPAHQGNRGCGFDPTQLSPLCHGLHVQNLTPLEFHTGLQSTRNIETRSYSCFYSQDFVSTKSAMQAFLTK